MKSFSAALATVGLLASSAVAADLNPIVVKGSKFFDSKTGDEFFIKGVAYQQDFTGGGAGSSNGGSSTSGQTYVDPLAQPDQCKRDIPYLQKLLTNVVRVYAINPSQNHDECMSMLADAGIYVFADMSAPVTGESINQDDPSWDDSLYTRYTSVVQAMQNYTNVIGFFAGNEVSNAPNNTNAMPYVKAAVRDIKAYIKQNSPRPLYIGYAADDDASIRVPVSEFMVCGDDDSAVDFWGYNIYEWCGHSSFQQSGYAARTQEFSTYAKPAFFAEYGCVTPPRLFEDTPVILGPQMDGVWSGGIVYMYFQTTNDYGHVDVSGDSVSLLPAYSAYSSEIAMASPTGVNMNDYNPTNTAWSCPTEGSDWNAMASPLPPTPNSQACSCLMDSLSCVVKSNVAATSYGKLFGYVCGKDNSACEGILSNGTTGNYGAWSMCSSQQQLSYVLNEYYKAQGSSSQACDFNGMAETKNAESLSGTCKNLVQAAGDNGANTLTATPPASASMPASSGAAKSSSMGSGAVSRMSHAESGLLPMVIMTGLAFVSGMGMLLL